jgi:hypothetical protein
MYYGATCIGQQNCLKLLISFDSIRPSETTTSNTGSLVQYKVKINNCAKIYEKINLASRFKAKDISHFFSIDKFDRVIGPFNVIAAESAGKIPLRVDRVG